MFLSSSILSINKQEVAYTFLRLWWWFNISSIQSLVLINHSLHGIQQETDPIKHGSLLERERGEVDWYPTLSVSYPVNVLPCFFETQQPSPHQIIVYRIVMVTSKWTHWLKHKQQCMNDWMSTDNVLSLYVAVSVFHMELRWELTILQDTFQLSEHRSTSRALPLLSQWEEPTAVHDEPRI